MLYFNFSGYEGFKARFGIQNHGNGEKSRKNKIILAFVKDKTLLHHAVISGDFSLINIESMSTLKDTMMNLVETSGHTAANKSYLVKLINYTFYSSKYETDEYRGICEDGDSRAVRYINHDNQSNKVFKMKAGKFIRALITETEFGKKLPEQVLVYLQEEFVADWVTYAMRTLPENRLYVNGDFSRIYDSSELSGDFHSCMVDECNHTFYSDSVKAKAAYLRNEEGKIVARCIIYTEVHEEGTDKIWRLAERQYSTDCNDVLKRALVDALIKGGHIDGYKKVGAGCGDAREFVDNNGNSLSDKKFWIDCCLATDDALSYQDSFKYYNYNEERAYNYSSVCYDYELDTTDGSIENNEDEYDEYHDRYCSDTTTVFYHGREISCDCEDLDDFTLIVRYNEYYHNDDCKYCCDTDQYEVESDCVYSELLESYYYDEDKMREDETKYKKENWYYSDFDDEFYENEEDVVSFWRWVAEIQDYEEQTIYVGTLMNMLKEKKLFVYEGEIYNQLRHGKPMHLAA